MTDKEPLARPEQTHAALVEEVVRRLQAKPRFAAAEPEALRELVQLEVRKGILTMFGLVRAIERSH